MADLYIPGNIPTEYNAQAIYDELSRISAIINALEINSVNLIPQAAEPDKYSEGDIVYADGTNWDPGSGAGVYERTASAWNKL